MVGVRGEPGEGKAGMAVGGRRGSECGRGRKDNHITTGGEVLGELSEGRGNEGSALGRDDKDDG
jgi:hypothetical protein